MFDPAAANSGAFPFEGRRPMINQLIVGSLGLMLALALRESSAGVPPAFPIAIAVLSVVPIFAGLSLLSYNLIGRYRLRDILFRAMKLRGDEQVLDARAGQGFFLVEAAKQLRHGGRASGVLSARGALRDLSLRELVGKISHAAVSDRIGLLHRDVDWLAIPGDSYNVVLYVEELCPQARDLHSRLVRWHEIARVAKPGARVLAVSMNFPNALQSTLAEAGIVVRSCRSCFLTTLSPMWIIDARLPAPRAELA